MSFVSSATTAAASAAHTAAAALSSTSQIKPGASVPDIPVKQKDPDTTISLAKLTGKNIILGVPGAFTPSCSNQIPGFIEKYDQFKSKGIDNIFVVCVNDIFVVNAWKEKLGRDSQVQFVADDKGAFTSAVGLLFDATPKLGGPRAKRYALIVENDKVKDVLVEANPPDVKVTSAENVLSKL